MSEQITHIITQEGQVFAAAMTGDTVDCAIEVEDTDPSLLAEQANAAIFGGDPSVAAWLTEEIAWGRAALIGAYFEVLA